MCGPRRSPQCGQFLGEVVEVVWRVIVKRSQKCVLLGEDWREVSSQMFWIDDIDYTYPATCRFVGIAGTVAAHSRADAVVPARLFFELVENWMIGHDEMTARGDLRDSQWRRPARARRPFPRSAFRDLALRPRR